MRRYFVPKNFASEGMIMGRFKTRNVMEAVVVVGAGLALDVFVLPGGFLTKLYIGIFIVVILGYIFVFGKNEASITQFLTDVIMFNRNKKVYGSPNNNDKIEREKRLNKTKYKTIKQREKEEKKYAKQQAKLEKREAREL